MNEIIFRENFPIHGEAYKVGELDGRYFFAWGHEYPFVDDASDLPMEDIDDGESGIEWFETETEAMRSFVDAVEASCETFAQTTKEELLEQIMTRREAERYLEVSAAAFQYHIRVGNISPVKEYGERSGKVQLFWKEDLEKLKNFLK